MTEPEVRFREENIEDTIVFFGSARSKPTATAEAELAALRAAFEGKDALTPGEASQLRKAEANLRLAPYYDAAVELSKRMTAWSKSIRNREHRFLVCTGGGPGMMEAANRGAREAAGASIGLGISLPFEQGLNEFVTHDLSFEFHYFFIRKYWFAYWAKALVVFPGGFGTMDELFEILTLLQTRKIEKQIPIVLYGSKFWNDILNFQAYADWGVISPEDLNLFQIVDSVEEAESYLTRTLTELHLKPDGGRNQHPPGPSA